VARLENLPAGIPRLQRLESVGARQTVRVMRPNQVVPRVTVVPFVTVILST